ncbi:MAG: tetratricopeptide repeat protein [Ruminococcus sp.]|jgi:tetratricopeptide (TPR) repeat protein|nr:tetratricopeptide repeat protein [Ruminococcus sp.]
MSKNYCSYPAKETGLRTVFLYAAPEDAGKLPALAQRIAHPHDGTECRVKWLNPSEPVDETDLKNELTLSQVLIVYVTKSLVTYINKRIAKKGLPLPIQFMRDNQKPYFPIADAAENLESYCKLDRPIHGLIESDSDFNKKLKEQLSKYVLDEETLSEVREKGIINQIFLSYRKDDVIAAQNLMREIHNFKGFDAISIWYDRFLTAGNLFDKEILDALDESKAFTMVISSNITAKREDGSDNYVVKHEYPRALEKKKPIVPIHLPNYACKHDDLKSVFKDIPELLAIEQTEPYLRSIFPDLPSVDTYSSERLYLLGRAYLAGYYFEQDTEKALSLFKKAAKHTDGNALLSSVLLAAQYKYGVYQDGINYDEALAWSLRTVELSEKIFGKEHKKTAEYYKDTGLVYHKKGNYQKALEYYFKALDIQEKVLGKNHQDTADSYRNIGAAYHYICSYEKALEYCFMAASIEEKVNGLDNPKMATSYNNIGAIYSEIGEYKKALESHLVAYYIDEKLFGKDHPNMATNLNNIGTVFYSAGDYDNALEYLSKALVLKEKYFGKDHPTTATTYFNLGEIYNKEGDYDKALEYYHKDLAITEKVLGKEHPNMAECYNSIAAVYTDQDDYEKAKEYCLKALEINEKVLGKDHVNTAMDYNLLGAIYSFTGELDKALEYSQKALLIEVKAYGPNHPGIKVIKENIDYINEEINKQKKKPGSWLKNLFK